MYVEGAILSVKYLLQLVLTIPEMRKFLLYRCSVLALSAKFQRKQNPPFAPLPPLSPNLILLMFPYGSQ